MKNPFMYFLLYLFLQPVAAFAKNGHEQKALSLTAGVSVQFIENKGQIIDQHGVMRKDIDVKIEANGVMMFVGDGALHYQWVKSRESGASVHPPSPFGDTPFEGGILPDASVLHESPTPTPPAIAGQALQGGEEKSDVEIYRMDVKLIGANKKTQVIFEEPTGYYENYYLAHTGEEGVRAKGYGRVIYKDIYPNIDLVFYTSRVSGASEPTPTPPERGSNSESSPARGDRGVGSRGIKYDFIIHPGGNPADIKLRYEGATELKLVDGALAATTPFGTITEAAPYSYEAETGDEIASSFVLTGNELTFSVAPWNGTLVIDPTLNWCTYYGGSSSEGVHDIATDKLNNIYASGVTKSTSNIATTSAFKTTYADSNDGFIVKFNEAGTRLWATYYGGTGNDNVSAITVDKDSFIYAFGLTYSASGIATAGAHQANKYPSVGDTYFGKFDVNGNRIWVSYYGGDGLDFASNIACNKKGDVFICGSTFSTNNIATPGAHQNTVGSFGCGFLAKFNASGVRQWGTYYGVKNVANSSGNTGYIASVGFDNNHNVYVCGYANADTGIATTNAHQTTLVNNGDGFIAKFNDAGVRQWGTYYGDLGREHLNTIVVTETGTIYVAGQTGSPANMVTQNTLQTSLASTADMLIAKFNTNGQRQWGTYLGGNGLDRVNSMKYHPSGRLFLFGTTESSGLATTGAYQTTLTGTNDAFLGILDTNGANLFYGTYFGSSGVENMAAGEFGYNGHVYIGGSTNSTSGFATSGVHQSSYGGGDADGFVADFIIDTLAYIRQPYVDTVACAGDSLYIPYKVTTAFNSNNVFSIELSDSTGSFANPVAIGSITANTADTVGCRIPYGTLSATGYRVRVRTTSPARVSEDNLVDIRIKAKPVNVQSTNNNPCFEDTLRLYGSTSSAGVTWAWTGPNSFGSASKDTFKTGSQLNDTGNYILKVTLNSTGCSTYDTTNVALKPLPDKPIAGSNSPVCETLPITLTTGSSTGGVSYSWAGPSGYSSNTQNPTVTTGASPGHAGDYVSIVTLNGCSRRDTVNVVVLPKPAKPTAAAPNSPLCQRQNLQLTASTITGASYSWYGPAAFSATVQNPVRPNMQFADAGAYYVYATVSGCISDTDSVVVVVNTDPFVNIFPTPGATICAGQQAIFTAVPTNGGATSYNWLVNGITTGSTGTTYSTTTLNNGDAVSCAMTSTGTCATPFIDTSNPIIMTVQPVLTPTVSIVADNLPPWNGGLTVTFTATPTHGGATPEYQWKRNGADVVGATGANWGVIVNALNANEDICVVLKSSYQCAAPETAMSNCITTAFTGVGDIVHDKSIKIYPNPVREVLYIEAPPGLPQGEVSVEFVDVLGRSARRQVLTAQGTSPYAPFKGGIDVSSLVPGLYVVRVNGLVVGRVVKE